MNYNIQPDHLRKEPEVKFEAGWINRLFKRVTEEQEQEKQKNEFKTNC